MFWAGIRVVSIDNVPVIADSLTHFAARFGRRPIARERTNHSSIRMRNVPVSERSTDRTLGLGNLWGTRVRTLFRWVFQSAQFAQRFLGDIAKRALSYWVIGLSADFAPRRAIWRNMIALAFGAVDPGTESCIVRSLANSTTIFGICTLRRRSVWIGAVTFRVAYKSTDATNEDTSGWIGAFVSPVPLCSAIGADAPRTVFHLMRATAEIALG